MNHLEKKKKTNVNDPDKINYMPHYVPNRHALAKMLLLLYVDAPHVTIICKFVE